MIRRNSGYIAPLLAAGILTLIMQTILPLSNAQQTTPPPPAEPRSVPLPRPSDRTLANGLRVIAIEDRDAPIVTIQLLVRSGGETDPSSLAGLAEMTGRLLTRGTATRTAPQIAEAIEALGGALESGAAWDHSYATATVLSSVSSAATQIVADVVRNPAFEAAELERLRRQSLDELTVELRQPRDIAGFAAARAVFGATAYGHPLGGTPESLRRIKRSDVAEMHGRYYRPDNCILAFAGDMPMAEAFALAERFFGDWVVTGTGRPRPVEDVAGPAAKIRPRAIVIDMADAGQAAVLVVRLGVKRTESDFFAAQVANSVLGGGYSSRLNQEVRIKRGLSYGASSRLDARSRAGFFSAGAQTKNESAAEVAQLVLSEMRKLETEPAPEEELVPRKAALIGAFGRALETTEGLAGQFSDLALRGLPLEQINTWIADVQGATGEQVRRCALNRLGTAGSSLIVVGDARKFLAALQRDFPQLEVIPLARLDLNVPSLRSGPRPSPPRRKTAD